MSSYNYMINIITPQYEIRNIPISKMNKVLEVIIQKLGNKSIYYFNICLNDEDILIGGKINNIMSILEIDSVIGEYIYENESDKTGSDKSGSDKSKSEEFTNIGYIEITDEW